MDQITFYIGLAVLGACMGSFAGATVWRLRALQLKQDKLAGVKIDKNEFNKLEKLISPSLLNDHSRCLDCNHRLKWYDLIPIVSWLSLGGRCRKCHKLIGVQELLIEVSMAAFFIISYVFWPYNLTTGFEIARFVLWLVAGVGLGILFVYDMRWSLLPDKVNYAVIVLGFLSSIAVVLNSSTQLSTVLNILGSVLVLSGTYLVIYLISKGRWVGFGDVKLGLGLALLLADWKLAFIALFAANLIGCLIVVPAMAFGYLRRDSRIPFGPLLIAGFLVAGLAGNYLLGLYFSTLS